MGKAGGHQKGPQDHAEGQHGPATERRIVEELGSGPAGEPCPDTGPRIGGHHLYEGRQQHDEAEKNSEKTRLSKSLEDRHRSREDYQVKGGDEGDVRSRPLPQDD
jgi:hypothetical protein